MKRKEELKQSAIRTAVLTASLFFSGAVLTSEHNVPHPSHEIESMTLKNSLRTHNRNLKNFHYN